MSQHATPLKCPKCGHGVIMTERRPDGFHHCQGCSYRWQSRPIISPLSQAEIDALKEQFRREEERREPFIEAILKTKLEPGDDLIVKLRGDMDSFASMADLREKLEEKYPSNRVLIFYLPEGCDIDFSVIKKI